MKMNQKNKKRLKWGIIILMVVAIEAFLGFKMKPSMKGVGEPRPQVSQIFGITIPGGINYTTIFITWIIMGILVIGSWLLTRKLRKFPSKSQLLVEKLVASLENLCEGSLGSKKKGRTFLPFVGTLFIFVAFANWLPILPIPGLEAPTGDLNTPLALALLCFFISHMSGIKYRGFKNYILEFFEPMLIIKGKKVPNPFMAVLNIVGEFGKVISHSFRLFGNILGGAIILLIISNLLHYILLPIALHAFFGLFIGGLQAFIFGMLGLTYISLLAGE